MFIYCLIGDGTNVQNIETILQAFFCHSSILLVISVNHESGHLEIPDFSKQSGANQKADF